MLTDLKITLFLVFMLALTPAAFGTSVLKAVLGDISVWDAAVKTDPAWADERAKVDYSYEQENAISSRDLNLNSTDAKLDLIIPLTKKSALEISSIKNTALVQMSNGSSGFDISNQSDVINLSYSAGLSDYLDVGVGVNQRRGEEIGAERNLGHSYRVKINPAGLFSLEYSAERAGAGAMARLNSDGNWVEYPAYWNTDNSRVRVAARIGNRLDLDLKYQRQDADPYRGTSANYGIVADGEENAEITAGCDLSDNVRFSGKVGKRANNQNLKIYREGSSLAHFQSDMASLFGVLGVACRLADADLSLNLFRSRVDLAGWGSSLSEYVPNMVSNITNADKALDLESQLTMNGCGLGLKRAVSDRLTFKGNVSYTTMSLSGSADLWNSFFFGMAKLLDQNYDLSFKRVDFLQAGLGLKYAVSDGYELNYNLQQLIPLYAENSVPAGANENVGGIADVSAANGGNMQTMSLTCYF